jgi:hypothetical protein
MQSMVAWINWRLRNSLWPLRLRLAKFFAVTGVGKMEVSVMIDGTLLKTEQMVNVN